MGLLENQDHWCPCVEGNVFMVFNGYNVEISKSINRLDVMRENYAIYELTIMVSSTSIGI